MRLTPEKKNELLDLVESCGLSLLNFEISYDDDSITFKYRDDYFVYRILRYEKDSFVNKRCDIQSQKESVTNFNWEHSKNTFHHWVKSVRKDRDEFQKFLATVHRTDLPAIASISTRFISVFKQAEDAEILKLDELVGMGYRKAFEILIRDYATRNMGDAEKQTVLTQSLPHCINTYILSDEIRILAHRIFWLANDHAHYEMLHTEYTAQDIKVLIIKTVDWMQKHEEWNRIKGQMQEEAREKEQQIQPKKRKVDKAVLSNVVVEKVVSGNSEPEAA